MMSSVTPPTNEVISKKIDLDCEEDVKSISAMSFVKFSAPRLERNAKGKKEVKPFFPLWKNKTVEEYAKMFKPSDKVICVLTGKINNITVFDFDKEGTYEECIEKHPELKQAYTVKTPKGFHVYCKYNPDYKTTANTKVGIDIRNDDAIVFGNLTNTDFGSKYVLLDNEKRLDLEMPKSFYEKVVPPSVQKVTKTKKKIVLKQAVVKDSKEEAPTFAKKVLQIIKPEYIDEMNNFRRIVWAMKNEGFSIADVEKVAKKSQHYDKDTFTSWFASTKLWDSKTNKNSCKIGTLIHFAKLSDEKKFYDTYIQHNSSSELNKSDIALAQIYLDILGDNLFYQDKKIYIYLQNEWWCDTEGHFVKKNFFTEMTKYYAKLKDEINKQINEIENEEGKEDEVEGLLAQIEEIKECKSHIYKVNTLNNVLSAIKTLMATLKEEIIFDTNEEQIYNIHFKNGVFDLNTNTFRQRNKDDYVSMYLSWDYEPEIVTDEAKEQLWDSICKIEPCPERRKCLLSYLAYSLTGDCSKQKYLNLIGYTAANGKSHTFKMMSKCFEFYTKKLSSNIFNIGNEKRHKEIIHLYQNPVRFAFIEELDNKKKLDAEYMKDIVDGSKVPVEVMYGTSVDVALQAKIITSSNGDPNIKMDDAILRRIVNLYLKSQFVEIEEDDWENRKFVRKDGAEKMFDCPIMKNAVFELLTRHEFKEFVIPDCVKNDTKDTADILNDFKDRFEAHYDITKNPEDVVNKHDFMEVLKISKTDLKKTISEMRQIGVDYNKDRKKDKVKGCFVGLKEIGSGEYLGEL
jgi:phage/plasmid-associated DNA primase